MVKRFLSNDVSKGAFYTLILQCASKGCRLLLWILLARVFTITQFSQFTFGISVAMIFSNVIFLGGTPVLAREWGRSDLSENDRLVYISKLSNWYFWRGLLLASAVLFVFWIYSVFKKIPLFSSIAFLSMGLVFPYFIFNIIKAQLVARRKVIIAYLVELFVNVGFVLIALFCGSLMHKSLAFILQAQLLVFTLSAIIFLLILQKKTILYSIKPNVSIVSFFSLQLGGLLFSLVDILILKLFSTASSLAHYSVALQMNTLIVFCLLAINQNMISYIASDVKRLDKYQLQQKLSSYARTISAYCSIVVIGIVVLGYPILALYGPSYTAAYWPLFILSLGSLINGLCGSVNMLLTMSGRERFSALVFWGVFLLNIMLSLCLVKPFGAIGVAFSVCVSTILWNIVMLAKVKKSIGVNPSIFSRWAFKKQDLYLS